MVEITRHVFVETQYAEVNVGAVVTPSGVICIDTPSYALDARDWAGRMHRLSPYPVQQLFLTDASGDRILNTRWLNAPMTMHRTAAMATQEYDRKYAQTMVESLTIRNPQRGRELNNMQIEHPTLNFTGEIILHKYGLPIKLRHAGGPTNGNCWVIFPEQAVMFVGDTLIANRHPHLLAPAGEAWLSSLAELKELASTYAIVGGRGELLEEDALGEAITKMVDYLTQMRDLVAEVATTETAFSNRELVRDYVTHFLPLYPLDDCPESWVRDQIQLSLGYTFDELVR